MKRSCLRAWIVLATLLAMHPYGAAAAQTPLRHHVIVLLDRSASMKNGDASRRADVEMMIRDGLPDALFAPGLVRDLGRALLEPGNGDVLSVVSFGLDMDHATDFSEFIQTADNGREFGFLRQSDVSPARFDDVWSAIYTGGYESFFSRRWSGISVAMPLALDHQGRHGAVSATPVHRTFIVLVTDDNYNGGDPNLELEHLAHRPALTEDRAAVQTRLEETRDLYVIKGPRARRREGGVYLKVFEVASNTSQFSVGTLWSFDPGKFEFHRAPGGFRSSFSLSPVGNPVMRPERVEALLMDGERVLQHQRFDAATREPVVQFAVSDAAAERPLQVRLRFWARQSDSVYGMHLLDPDGGNPALTQALMQTIPVRFEPPQRIVGLIPIGPRTYGIAARFGADDQEEAARYWNVMAIVFVALLAVVSVLAWAWKHGAVKDPRVMRDHRI
jgi:hypothetical protein